MEASYAHNVQRQKKRAAIDGGDRVFIDGGGFATVLSVADDGLLVAPADRGSVAQQHVDYDEVERVAQ